MIESDYDDLTWRIIWTDLKKHFDNDKPRNINTITDSQKKYKQIMNDYIKRNCKVIAELPKIIDKLGKRRRVISFLLISYLCKIIDHRIIQFVKVICKKCEVIEHGINFMRVEASEILAFIITDSERICKPGIPPHLPIANGLRGHSLPMKIML